MTTMYVQNLTPHRVLDNKTPEEDFSCETWIYFLKEKSEIFSKFKEYKAFVENQTNRKIKTLWLDNGGEITSKEFKELCRESGIKRELSTPYNPEQNGVVEQKN